MMLPPGSTIGILGGGQLGRMLAMAAAQLGYRAHIFAPEEDSVAADVAAGFTCADYADDAALLAFARSVDAATYEFENIALGPVERVAALVPVHPSPRVLGIAQDRVAEKMFVGELGGRTAAWRSVPTDTDLDSAITEVGLPAILKTTRLGYDGKGQARLHEASDAKAAWQAIGGGSAILEAVVAFDHEFSILIARGIDGATLLYDPPHNEHEDGILARSSLPAPAAILAQRDEAVALACRVADALDYVGVLTLEFFAAAEGPVFNEMAPRVHNSGHWTIEGALTSQFENHIRAIAGLPLGPTGLIYPKVEMRNLIGDDVAAWPALFAEAGLHVHLYGKGEARPGRKMGHWTRLG